MAVDTNQIVEDDEVTLKELILRVKEYFLEIRRRWLVVLLFCTLFSAFFLYKALKTKPEFEAQLTFMLDQGDKGGGGGLGMILGQFGLGGSGGGNTNLNTICQLAVSDRIMNTTLFTEGTIDGQKDVLANHIIRIYDFHKQWAKDTTGLLNFVFKRNEFEAFSRVENNALKKIIELLRGKQAIFSCGFAKESGILKMRMNSINEDFSIQFTRILFGHLSEFYVNNSTERERNTYNIIRAQKDSIYGVMKSKEIGAAQFQDYNRGLILQSEQMKSTMMKKDATVATSVYGEVLKNFAVADFALRNNTPFITPVDLPTSPIEPVKVSKLFSLISGFLLGLFVSSVLIIGRVIYLKAMK